MQQSGTAFDDYYHSQTYNSVYNAYEYNGSGELTQAETYRGTAPTSGSPAGTDALPGRNFDFKYDNIGNRSEAGPAIAPSAANDAYAANSANEYTSRTVNTQRIIGNSQVGASLTSDVAPLGVLDRNFGGYAVAPSNAAPTSNAMTITATINTGSGTVTSSASRNWLLPINPATPQYDGDGNLSKDGIWQYKYDAENRLIQMLSISPGIGGVPYEIDFKYDYLGRRVEKIVDQTSSSGPTLDRRYIYDGADVVAEVDASTGSTVRAYAWGLDESGAIDGAGGLLAVANMTSSTVSQYYAGCDSNGNVSLLYNPATGSLAAAYEYSPFGVPLRVQAFDSTVADNPIRFSSKYTDVETGLVYYGERYYSPTWGRFINRDPIGEAGGMNLYGFCGNDPINNVDILGEGNTDEVAQNAQQKDHPAGDDKPLQLGYFVVYGRYVANGLPPGELNGEITHYSGTIQQAAQRLPANLTFWDPITKTYWLNGERVYWQPGGVDSNGGWVAVGPAIQLPRFVVSAPRYSGLPSPAAVAVRAAIQGGGAYLKGLLWTGPKGLVLGTWSLLTTNPVKSVNRAAYALGTFAGMLRYEPTATLGAIGHSLTNPETMGESVFGVVSMMAPGALASKESEVVKLLEEADEVPGPATSGGEIRLAAESDAGRYLVYQSLNDANEVQYVGITSDFEMRQAAHLAGRNGSGVPFQITRIPGLDGLSLEDAEAVEQTLIDTYGLGKNGGTLLNKINSISPTANPEYYLNSSLRGQELLNAASYPGF